MLPTIDKLKEQAATVRENAQSLARSAKYLRAAAAELAPIVLPAAKKAALSSVHSAGKALAFVPAFPDKAANKLATLDEQQLKRGVIIVTATGVAFTVAFTTASIAHVVNRRRKRREREEEKALAAADAEPAQD